LIVEGSSFQIAYQFLARQVLDANAPAYPSPGQQAMRGIQKSGPHPPAFGECGERKCRTTLPLTIADKLFGEKAL